MLTSYTFLWGVDDVSCSILDIFDVNYSTILETLFFLVVPLSIHVCFLIYVLVTRCEWQIWRMLLSTLVKFLGVLKRSIFKERTKFKNGMLFRTTLLFKYYYGCTFHIVRNTSINCLYKCAPRWINILVFSMLSCITTDFHSCPSSMFFPLTFQVHLFVDYEYHMRIWCGLWFN
jgi:hypothetical protein